MFSFLKHRLTQSSFLFLRGRHFVLIDTVIIILSYYLSYVVRFDLGKYTEYYDRFSLFAFVLIIVRLPIFYGFGLYQRLWRYASVKELFEIIFAVSAGSGLALVSLTVANLFQLFPGYIAFPRSIFALEWMLTLILIGGSRFAIRI